MKKLILVILFSQTVLGNQCMKEAAKYNNPFTGKYRNTVGLKPPKEIRILPNMRLEFYKFDKCELLLVVAPSELIIDAELSESCCDGQPVIGEESLIGSSKGTVEERGLVQVHLGQ